MTYIMLLRDAKEFNESLAKIQAMADDEYGIDSSKLSNEVDSMKKLLDDITTDFVKVEKKKKRNK